MDFQEAPVAIVAIPDGYRISTVGSIHTNTGWIEQEFKKVLDHKPKVVELDMSKTDYVSSWGIGVLTALRRGVVAAGGQLKVTAIQKQVMDIFRYSGLLDVFQIVPSVVVKPA